MVRDKSDGQIYHFKSRASTSFATRAPVLLFHTRPPLTTRPIPLITRPFLAPPGPFHSAPAPRSRGAFRHFMYGSIAASTRAVRP